MAHLASRRNKQTGNLESMAISIDAISDKTSAGAHSKLREALVAAAEAYQETAELGLLDDAVEIVSNEAADGDAAGSGVAGGAAASDDDAAPPDAAAFHAQRRAALSAKLAAKIRELRFSASQNDRATPARKQARLACGGDGSGGAGDVKDGATCAHHAVANVGELGRKAIDAPLKALMKITEEQSSADSAKVKCLRTSVGWCVRPRCARDAPELCPGYARDVPETVEQPAPEMWRVRRPREVHPIAPRRSRALVVVGFRRRPAR